MNPYAEFLELVEKGKDNEEIARATKRNVGGVQFLRYILKSYKKGRPAKNTTYKLYFSWFDDFYKNRRDQSAENSEIYKEPLKIVNSNNLVTREEDLQAIEKAFAVFQDAIATVIEHESERKAQEKITDVKVKYEKELERLQALIVQAKNGSIVGTIRRAWNM